MEEERNSYFTRTLQSIDKGLAGGNAGIPIPFKRLSGYIPNIQQKTYYLLSGPTKSGKTSLTDDIFLYGAYDYYKSLKDKDELDGFDLDIDYFSFEIDIETKITKGISRKLWHDYGIIADSKEILSKGKYKCSKELYDLIYSFREYFEELEEILNIFPGGENPTGIYKYLDNKASKHGEIVKKNINTNPDQDPILRFSHYIPHNPKRYHLYFIDHLALTMEERGFTLKQTMDKASQYSVVLRNQYSMTPIIIQQMGFETTNDDRFKSERLTPTIRDLGDSRYPIRDCDLAISIFSPYSVGLKTFQGYDITRLKDSFRNLEILVDRNGEPNINLGLNFIGPSGTFREMPRASEITNAHYDAASSYYNEKPKYIKEGDFYIPNPKLIT